MAPEKKGCEAYFEAYFWEAYFLYIAFFLKSDFYFYFYFLKISLIFFLLF